jgi:thiamine biosynthesis lipoprotein
MGTVCEITVPDNDARYIDEAFAEGKRVESMISTWRDDSMLARVNAGENAVLTQELAFDLATTVKWARETGGAFNPLIRPLIDAWKTREGGAVPTQATIDAALKRTNLANVDMLPSGAIVLRNGAVFEEGGWGKGLAIDRMLNVFRKHGAMRARINFGGQIGKFGEQPFVTIADPQQRDKPAVGLPLAKQSISTSSGSEKVFNVGGRTFTHLIDPRSGVALPPRGSVSVIENSAFLADILSTALYVMGADAGLAWAHDHKINAIFITDKNEVLTTGVAPLDVDILDPKFTLKR